MPAKPLASHRSRSAILCSTLWVILVVCFCIGTRWGQTYATFAQRSWLTWKAGRNVSAETRRAALYDETYPVLVYIREFTPADAVILLPPRQFVRDHFGGQITHLEMASSVYNFIYPRIPVHYGDASPYKDRITHLLVWEHWGLDLIGLSQSSQVSPRIGLYPWPRGKAVPW